jgi:hypothetical protein
MAAICCVEVPIGNDAHRRAASGWCLDLFLEMPNVGLKGRSYAHPKFTRSEAHVQARFHHMTVIKRRSRRISIRVSDEEYVAVQSLCSNTGARHVSEFARTAMNAALIESSEGAALRARIELFGVQLERLVQKIDHLTARLG